MEAAIETPSPPPQPHDGSFSLPFSHICHSKVGSTSVCKGVCVHVDECVPTVSQMSWNLIAHSQVASHSTAKLIDVQKHMRLRLFNNMSDLILPPSVMKLEWQLQEKFPQGLMFLCLFLCRTSLLSMLYRHLGTQHVLLMLKSLLCDLNSSKKPNIL